MPQGLLILHFKISVILCLLLVPIPFTVLLSKHSDPREEAPQCLKTPGKAVLPLPTPLPWGTRPTTPLELWKIQVAQGWGCCHSFVPSTLRQLTTFCEPFSKLVQWVPTLSPSFCTSFPTLSLWVTYSQLHWKHKFLLHASVREVSFTFPLNVKCL